MSIERQLGDYGRHLQQVITDLRVPVDATPAIRPVPSDAPVRHPGWLIPAVGAAVAVTMIVSVVVFGPGSGTEPVPLGGEGPATPAVVDPVTPIVVQVVEGGAAVLESPPLLLGRDIAFARSGDTLWAFDGDGGVAGYRDGVWRGLSPVPGSMLDPTGNLNGDVSGTLDGQVWVLSDINPWTHSTLWHLEAGDWRQVPEEVLLPTVMEDVESIEVDQSTGNVWLTAPDGLLRWDGVEVTSAGSPPIDMVLDEIAVTGDGTVWAAGFNPFFSYLPAGLVRYHPDTGTWESVRPLGADIDVPAMVAPTPNGNLWVLVADVPQWPLTSPRDRVSWVGPSAWLLAYLDITTSEWTVYDVPDGYPGDMVADDEAVWLRHQPLDSGEPVLVRFDRQTWTTYSHPAFDDLGIAGDGTLWVSIRYTNRMHRLLVDGAASP